MIALMGVIILVLVGTPGAAKPVGPQEFNACIYNYWESRSKGAVIDADAVHQNAKAALLPNVSTSLAGQADYFNQPQTGAQTFLGATITQQIINLSNWMNIHATGLSEKAAELDLEDQLLTLMKNATTAFYSQLQAAIRLRLLQKRLPRLEKAVTLARETKRLRLQDASSVYLSEADKTSLDVSITNAETDATTQLNLLKSTVGMTNGNLELDENFDTDLKNDLGYWLGKVEDLPSLQNLRTKAEASGATAEAARDQVVPSLAASFAYGHRLTAPNPPNYLTAETTLSALTLTFPLFDQGLRNIASQQAESQKMVNEAQYKSKKEALLAEVKNLFVTWQADEKALVSARNQLEFARKGYQSLITLYSFSKASFFDTRIAESSLIDAETQYETLLKKIVGEKMVLKLMGDYTNGRYHPSREAKCTLLK